MLYKYIGELEVLNMDDIDFKNYCSRNIGSTLKLSEVFNIILNIFISKQKGRNISEDIIDSLDIYSTVSMDFLYLDTVEVYTYLRTIKNERNIEHTFYLNKYLLIKEALIVYNGLINHLYNNFESTTVFKIYVNELYSIYPNSLNFEEDYYKKKLAIDIIKSLTLNSICPKYLVKKFVSDSDKEFLKIIKDIMDNKNILNFIKIDREKSKIIIEEEIKKIDKVII